MPTRWYPSRPPRAARKPNKEDGTDREVRKRIGHVPVRPIDPIIRQRSAAENGHERAAQGRERRAYPCGYTDIEGCFSERSEPGRIAHEAAYAVGVQQGDHAVGGESDQ